MYTVIFIRLSFRIVPEVVVAHESVVLGVLDGDVDGAGVVNVPRQVANAHRPVGGLVVVGGRTRQNQQKAQRPEPHARHVHQSATT